MATLTNTIPEKTIERLSEYRRTLLASHRQGITHIFSHVLAGIHGITAVQVRRDLMLIGFSSDTKKGYDVQVLIEYISRILDSPSPMNIAVLGMGVAGAAIATIASQFFSAILTLIALLHTQDSYRLIVSKIRFHRDLLFDIIKIGLPAGLQSAMYSISNLLIQSSINGFGATVIAGNAAAGNIESFVYFAMNALYRPGND